MVLTSELLTGGKSKNCESFTSYGLYLNLWRSAFWPWSKLIGNEPTPNFFVNELAAAAVPKRLLGHINLYLNPMTSIREFHYYRLPALVEVRISGGRRQLQTIARTGWIVLAIVPRRRDH